MREIVKPERLEVGGSTLKRNPAKRCWQIIRPDGRVQEFTNYSAALAALEERK